MAVDHNMYENSSPAAISRPFRPLTRTVCTAAPLPRTSFCQSLDGTSELVSAGSMSLQPQAICLIVRAPSCRGWEHLLCLTRAALRHWQLRSLIGTEGQNAVYFPVGATSQNVHVQRLNTKTRETETIRKLSFVPRCLVARNGWVCCGGETGTFSAFRVGEPEAPGTADRRVDLQPDDRFPLALDLSDATLSLLAQPRFEKTPLARSSTFGKDRVNCITLWFPPTLVQPFEGAYDQDVAVLANNDSSVIVVSLRDQEALDKVTYPDFMNRGVISPDGRLLIAISDDPYLYIHERKEQQSENGSPLRGADRRQYEWSPCGRIQLKSQKKEDRSDNRFILPDNIIPDVRVANPKQRKLRRLLFQHGKIPGGGDPVRHHLCI